MTLYINSGIKNKDKLSRRTLVKGRWSMQFLANLAFRMFLIWLFGYFNWMSFTMDGRPIEGFWEYLLFAFVGGILLWVLTVVLAIPYMMFAAMATILTLGLFVFVLDAVFYSLLIWSLSVFMPEYVQIQGFWMTLLCGFILSFGKAAISAVFSDEEE